MNYNLLFIWLAIVALIINYSRSGYLVAENGLEKKCISKGYAVLIFAPIIIFVCMSTSKYWVDYYNYLNNYISFPIEPSEAFAFIRAKNNSWLFYIFTYLIKVLFDGNITAYRLTLVITQSVPFIFLFRKYSTDYVFSIFLFVATAVPLAWMLNCVRQFIAAGIMYAATPAIIHKKYFKVCLMVLLATLFHQTAIIMLPCIVVALGTAWNKKTLLAIIGAVILTFIFSHVSGATETLIESAGYRMERLVGDDGAHPLRVLISFIPVLLAWFDRKTIEEDGSPEINYFINMAIISFCIFLIAMVTSGILVARISIYMMLYNFILLPYLIRKLFYGGTRILVFFCAIVSYLIYYYLLYGRRY